MIKYIIWNHFVEGNKMKFFKKAVVILLCLIFSISACTVVYSANSSAKLYSFYTNNMLFKQNEKAYARGQVDFEKGIVTLY